MIWVLLLAWWVAYGRNVSDVSVSGACLSGEKL